VSDRRFVQSISVQVGWGIPDSTPLREPKLKVDVRPRLKIDAHAVKRHHMFSKNREGAERRPSLSGQKILGDLLPFPAPVGEVGDEAPLGIQRRESPANRPELRQIPK